MNAPKVNENDYMQFLIAAQRVYSCVEAERVSLQAAGATTPDAAAHDAYTRLLSRLPPDTNALWREVETLVELKGGVSTLDDSTLDKPYARQIELVTRHWSGKHHNVVSGINLQSLVWSDGEKVLPTDCRLYAKAEDGFSKNEHARAMFRTAKERGMKPKMTMFDSWYSGLDNLKLLREQRWPWCRLKSNRQVNPNDTRNIAVSQLDIPGQGKIVHLKGYGMIKLFRTVAKDGDADNWATSQLDMTAEQFEVYAQRAWTIETYHRAIKQCVGIEKAQVRSSKAQRNHILLALRAFVRLELNRLRTGVSWYQAKHEIVRDAIHDYLEKPWYVLEASA